MAQHAVLAIEDKGFYEHGALNWTSLTRALVENAKAGQVVQGGSTLTQQLVKNTLGLDPTDETFDRKFQELALAMRVEEKYTKDQIFELYLNQVYMGNGVYGFGTASEFYFGKPASKLTLAEGATLAGVIRAPEYWDPIDHPVRTKVRRNDVLNRMIALGPDWINPIRAGRAKEQPLGLAEGAGKLRLRQPPFFVKYLTDEILQNKGGVYDDLGRTSQARQRTLLEGGLNIVTTLDAGWQADAQAAARLPYAVTPATPAGAPPPDTSIVTLDNQTGAIRTMLSGRNFRADKRNLATTRHQPGSSWKPFLLAAAFEQGVPPTRTYDSSSPFCDPRWNSPDHCVSNAEGHGQGLVNLYTATTHSINVVFAQLILDVGPDIVDGVAQRVMGIDEDEFNIPGVASLATGSVDFSPLEMAQGLPDVRERRRPLRAVLGAADLPRRQGALPPPARLPPRAQGRHREPDHQHARDASRSPAPRQAPFGAGAHGRSRGRPARRTTTWPCGSAATRSSCRRRSGWGRRGTRTRWARSSAAPSRRRSGVPTCPKRSSGCRSSGSPRHRRPSASPSPTSSA